MLLSLQSCKKYDAFGNEIKFLELYKANWLLGDWEVKDSTGILKESWKSIDDSTYTGQSLYIKDKDTIHFETMQLMQDGDFLIYTTTIKGENHNRPNSFELIEDKDSLLVFENKKIDYPNKIRYQREIDNNIQVIVFGKQNGKETSDSYLLKSIPKY
jgi:hypothetical protein